MDDLVIRGGGILDGSGTDAVRSDFAIRDGRIVTITPRYSRTARREVDAQGSIVTLQVTSVDQKATIELLGREVLPAPGGLVLMPDAGRPAAPREGLQGGASLPGDGGGPGWRSR